MATIIIGMGNPVRSDDSVGLKVVRDLRERLQAKDDVATCELYAGGIRLMEAMRGFQKAIIVDALVTVGGEPGTVHCLRPSDVMMTRNTCSTHDASLIDALNLGKSLGLPLPEEVAIWAIEAGDVETFSEDLTEPVKAAVPKVVQSVLCQIEAPEELRA